MTIGFISALAPVMAQIGVVDVNREGAIVSCVEDAWKVCLTSNLKCGPLPAPLANINDRCIQESFLVPNQAGNGFVLVFNGCGCR